MLITIFENMNSYPKDSDKIMLARQTGLSRGQVPNAFFEDCFFLFIVLILIDCLFLCV